MKRLKYTKLTRKYQGPGYGMVVWIDLDEIVHMEREDLPKTSLVLPDSKHPLTHISLKNGRGMDVTETPEEIMDLMEQDSDRS